jgi:hypothetical protein
MAVEPIRAKEGDLPFPVRIGTFVGRDGQAYEVRQQVFKRDGETIAKSRAAALQMIAAYVTGQTQGMMLGSDFDLIPVTQERKQC